MGAFLGLAGGLVLAVILAFKGARELSASPGVAPYTDPRFADHGPDIVAGFIGQKLFAVGGAAALVLLGVAVLALIVHAALCRGRACTGSRPTGWVRGVALAGTIALMVYATTVTLSINARWPGLYDTSATAVQIADRRVEFNRLHERSERVVTIAWLCGLVALGVSPWCREPAAPRARADADAPPPGTG